MCGGVADVVTGKGGGNTALPISTLDFLQIPSPAGRGRRGAAIASFSNRRDAWVRVLLCVFLP